jgi:predicted RNase H-like nuclease (RuvC/YqgF family)
MWAKKLSENEEKAVKQTSREALQRTWALRDTIEACQNNIARFRQERFELATKLAEKWNNCSKDEKKQWMKHIDAYTENSIEIEKYVENLQKELSELQKNIRQNLKKVTG